MLVLGVGWLLHIGVGILVPLTACIALVCAEFQNMRPIAGLLSKDGDVPDPRRTPRRRGVRSGGT